MSKLETAIAGAVSLLLLSSCGSKEAAATDNSGAAAEAEAPANSISADPTQPGPSNAAAEPVPPPDAVSHPGGYLPPAPAEPEAPAANSSGPGMPPPATEDQYIRNGQ